MTNLFLAARVIRHHPRTVRNRGWRAAILAVVWLGFQSCNSQAATMVVTNLGPSGLGTLRSALTNAQNGDVITFAVTGLITNDVTGGLSISNNVSIVGPGPDLLSITGTNGSRAFIVSSGVTVTISGLTFTNCAGWDSVIGSGFYGGTIYNAGNLSLSNCLFTGCHSQSGRFTPSYNGSAGGTGGSGGVIYNGGTLVAVSCQFLNNAAGSGGPGAAGNASLTANWTAGGTGGGGGSGGAVCDAGTASFRNCTFGWNGSGNGGAGGVGANGFWSAPLGPHNAGPGWVGGPGGDAGNGSAVFSLGGATFTHCTFFGNTNGAGGAGGTGGAGYMANNPGAQGGAGGKAGSGTLYSAGAAQLIACTFVSNTAGKGGNAGGGGAGANDTLGGNGGNGGAGGNGANGGSGGGIMGPATNSAFTLQNVLIAQNLVGGAGAAGGGGAGGSGSNGGSAGAIGSAGTNGLAGTGPDLCGSFISQGHNLVGLSTGNTGFTNNVLGNIVGTNTAINAKVGTLASNSGWVWTCALQNGSPALDAGDDTITGSPFNLTDDARGYPRQSGLHVDIGAYEHQWATTPATFNPAITGNGVQLAITNTPGAYFTVLGASSLATPLANWTVLGVMSEISPGQFQWTDASYASHSMRFLRLRNP
jgi:hypothetical protein